MGDLSLRIAGANNSCSTTWSVTVSPPVQADSAWRARLLEDVRPQLERRLQETPEATEFVLGRLLQVRLRHVNGRWRPGARILLSYLDERPAPAGANGARTGDKNTAGPLVRRLLPDDRLEEQAAQLVGLDGIRDEVLLHLECRWEGRLTTYTGRTGCPVPAALRTQLEDTAPLFLFAGDPGVGKTALAQVIAHLYCRAAETAGQLYWLTTAARGDGTVGDFSQRVRAAFETVTAAAASTPSFLLIDEADALAMRRSENQAHQEDRAGTGTLLQSLDALAGKRVAVFLTTNLLTHIDPAVERRGTVYRFERPDGRMRRELVKQWLPGCPDRVVIQAAHAARGMTPADLQRALTGAYLDAIRADRPLAPQGVIERLRSAERTRRV